MGKLWKYPHLTCFFFFSKLTKLPSFISFCSVFPTHASERKLKLQAVALLSVNLTHSRHRDSLTHSHHFRGTDLLLSSPSSQSLSVVSSFRSSSSTSTSSLSSSPVAVGLFRFYSLSSSRLVFIWIAIVLLLWLSKLIRFGKEEPLSMFFLILWLYVEIESILFKMKLVYYAFVWRIDA